MELSRVRNRWIKVHNSPPTEADIDRLYANFTPLQKESVLKFSDLIPGKCFYCLASLLEFLIMAGVKETIVQLRHEGIKIGSCTGFASDIVTILKEEGSKQGYVPGV